MTWRKEVTCKDCGCLEYSRGIVLTPWIANKLGLLDPTTVVPPNDLATNQESEVWSSLSVKARINPLTTNTGEREGGKESGAKGETLSGFGRPECVGVKKEAGVNGGLGDPEACEKGETISTGRGRRPSEEARLALARVALTFADPAHSGEASHSHETTDSGRTGGETLDLMQEKDSRTHVNDKKDDEAAADEATDEEDEGMQGFRRPIQYRAANESAKNDVKKDKDAFTHELEQFPFDNFHVFSEIHDTSGAEGADAGGRDSDPDLANQDADSSMGDLGWFDGRSDLRRGSAASVSSLRSSFSGGASADGPDGSKIWTISDEVAFLSRTAEKKDGMPAPNSPSSRLSCDGTIGLSGDGFRDSVDDEPTLLKHLQKRTSQSMPTIFLNGLRTGHGDGFSIDQGDPGVAKTDLLTSPRKLADGLGSTGFRKTGEVGVSVCANTSRNDKPRNSITCAILARNLDPRLRKVTSASQLAPSKGPSIFISGGRGESDTQCDWLDTSEDSQAPFRRVYSGVDLYGTRFDERRPGLKVAAAEQTRLMNFGGGPSRSQRRALVRAPGKRVRSEYERAGFKVCDCFCHLLSAHFVVEEYLHVSHTSSVVACRLVTLMDDGAVANFSFQTSGSAESQDRLRWVRAIQSCGGNGNQVVVKIVHKARCDVAELERCMKELVVFSEVRDVCDHIIELLGAINGANELWMFFERAPYGDLQQMVDEAMHGVRLDEELVKHVIFQILRGIRTLHEHHWIHHDIKPKNVLVFSRSTISNENSMSSSEGRSPVSASDPMSTSDRSTVDSCMKGKSFSDFSPEAVYVRIGDFGLARELPKAVTSPRSRRRKLRFEGLMGSHGYYAPEILLRKDYDEKIDIWSLGTIAFIMLAGYPPFYPASACIRETLAFDSDTWETRSPESRAFCAALLWPVPDDRPGAAELISHAWFKSILDTFPAAPPPSLSEREGVASAKKEREAFMPFPDKLYSPSTNAGCSLDSDASGVSMPGLAPGIATYGPQAGYVTASVSLRDASLVRDVRDAQVLRKPLSFNSEGGLASIGECDEVSEDGMDLTESDYGSALPASVPAPSGATNGSTHGSAHDSSAGQGSGEEDSEKQSFATPVRNGDFSDADHYRKVLSQSSTELALDGGKDDNAALLKWSLLGSSYSYYGTKPKVPKPAPICLESSVVQQHIHTKSSPSHAVD